MRLGGCAPLETFVDEGGKPSGKVFLIMCKFNYVPSLALTNRSSLHPQLLFYFSSSLTLALSVAICFAAAFNLCPAHSSKCILSFVYLYF